jgi:hypothetical protein
MPPAPEPLPAPPVMADDSRFPGYVAPTPGAPAQMTAAQLREEVRIANRRAGREFDIASGRVVNFRGR